MIITLKPNGREIFEKRKKRRENTYVMSSNSPSGGMKLIVLVESNSFNLTH